MDPKANNSLNCGVIIALFKLLKTSLKLLVVQCGVAGESILILSKHDRMKFISRDDGASWEVAFEFPVYAAFLDFGNIIVAIRKPSFSKNSPVKQFFYSLDQGNDWREYYLGEPTHAFDLVLDGWGLKAMIGLGKKKTGNPLNIPFTQETFRKCLTEVPVPIEIGNHGICLMTSVLMVSGTALT